MTAQQQDLDTICNDHKHAAALLAVYRLTSVNQWFRKGLYLSDFLTICNEYQTENSFV